MKNSVQTVDLIEFMNRNRGWLMALGGIMLVLGAAAVALPALAGLTVAVVLGWLLLVSGAFQLAHAFRSRATGHVLWEVAIAAVSLITGAIVLLNPVEGLFALTVVLVAMLVIEGIIQILLALRMHPSGYWRWMLANGVLGLILSMFIWAGLPETAGWALGLLVGVNLLFNGIMLLTAASMAKRL